MHVEFHSGHIVGEILKVTPSRGSRRFPPDTLQNISQNRARDP